ncbi:MAG: hypothetical protein MUE44_01800 [Oscillatoriaceae cyanobacterium Prado104]|jgi:hypothetical protein|nr:hypothetical protein [Oscillatoriaceae cyanobacterium Prado104]
MKKFQVLAGIVAAVALSGGIAFADPASAYTCSFGKSKAAQSGSGTTVVGSGGSDQMNPWKSYKVAALGFLGLAAALGGGAAYMSYRAGKKAKAACDAMSDNFEVFEETVEPTAGAAVAESAEVPVASELAAIPAVEKDAPVAEAAETVAVVREHPEAPGGELDLPAVEVGEWNAGSAIAK